MHEIFFEIKLIIKNCFKNSNYFFLYKLFFHFLTPLAEMPLDRAPAWMWKVAWFSSPRFRSFQNKQSKEKVEKKGTGILSRLVLDKWAYWRKKQNWRRNKDKVYEVIDQISALSNCLTVMAKMTRTLSEGWVKSKMKKYYSFSVIPEPGFEFCSPIQFWCRVKNSNG